MDDLELDILSFRSPHLFDTHAVGKGCLVNVDNFEVLPSRFNVLLEDFRLMQNVPFFVQ